MKAKRGRIRVGTCSWQDETLVKYGGFYPSGMRSTDMISYYARHFDVVEVDTSYYRFVPADTFEEWAAKTPEGFTFNVKVPGIFTNQGMEFTQLPKDIRKELDEELENKNRIYLNNLPPDIVDELWRRLDESMQPLVKAGKLGWLLFQFPHYFHFGSEREEYLLQCRERLPRHVLAIEFRALDWFRDSKTMEDRSEKTLSFLEENELAFVAVDEPQGTKASIPPIFAATNPRYAIVRLHGRKAETWLQNVKPFVKFDWNYSEEEIREWLAPIMGASQDGVEVHAKFNTNNGGQGVENSLKMKMLLGQLTEEQYKRTLAAIHARQREQERLRREAAKRKINA